MAKDELTHVKKDIKTPLMELRWVFITGDGRDQSENNDGSKMQKMVTAVAHKDSDAAKALIAQINSVWEAAKEANPTKIKKATEPKSLGYKPIKDKETDEETGELAFQFKTNSFYSKDKKPVKIPVLNASGKEVDLGGRLIGNGSIGVVHGAADVYTFKGSYGITLYLKGVQLKKFIEADFGVIEGEDLSDDDADTFTGFDESGIDL